MTHNMTSGPITPSLVKFTIPLVLGNLFQLTYNAADSVIVGRFVGEDALAAVGTSNPLMTLAILFINGMCLGAGILVSNAFGAEDYSRLEKQVSTTAIAGGVFSLGFSLLCILLARPLLRLMQVPAEVLPIAVSYLRVVFAGLIFTFFYNFLAATLRALGDKQECPLLFDAQRPAQRVRRSVLRGGHGLGCGGRSPVHRGQRGAVLPVLRGVHQSQSAGALPGPKWLVFEPSMLRQTVQYGWTTAMQQGTVQLGKIAIHYTYIYLGVNAMAAFAAASRVDDFAYTPQQNIGHAMTTLMAQNRGAGKHERVRQGFLAGMRIEAVYGLAIMAVCFFGAGPIMRLFADEPEVVALGVRFLRLVSLLYLLPSATNGIQGGFRGVGQLQVTLNSSLLNMGGRVAAAALFVLVFHMDIEAPALELCGGLAVHAGVRAAPAVQAAETGEF